MRKLALAAALAAALPAAAAAQGVIVDAGHYHGQDNAYLDRLVALSQLGSARSHQSVLWVGSGYTFSTPHTLSNTLAGHTLGNYAAVWLDAERYTMSGADATALRNFVTGGGVVGLSSLASGPTSQVNAFLGFDLSTGASHNGYDQFHVTTVGSAAGLPTPPAVFNTGHYAFSTAHLAANGFTTLTEAYGANSGFTMTAAQMAGRASTVPEPGTYALLATGLGALGLVARRRRAAA